MSEGVKADGTLVMNTKPVTYEDLGGKMEALARTWELLDVLPPSKASDDFLTKTMANLKVLETPFRLTDQWWFVPVRRVFAIAGWITALFLCGWLGFQITRHWIADPHAILLNDLPVIENLDHLQEVRELEFLNELKRANLFDDAQEK